MRQAKELHALYYRDGRLFSQTPRNEWWMVGKLFHRTTFGLKEVQYDEDGIEVGSIVHEGYREWLRWQRGKAGNNDTASRIPAAPQIHPIA